MRDKSAGSHGEAAEREFLVNDVMSASYRDCSQMSRKLLLFSWIHAVSHTISTLTQHRAIQTGLALDYKGNCWVTHADQVLTKWQNILDRKVLLSIGTCCCAAGKTHALWPNPASYLHELPRISPTPPGTQRWRGDRGGGKFPNRKRSWT